LAIAANDNASLGCASERVCGERCVLYDVPFESDLGYCSFRYQFTASPPLGCQQRLQAAGSDVLGLNVVVILK